MPAKKDLKSSTSLPPESSTVSAVGCVMPGTIAEELIKALQNEDVIAALTSIFAKKIDEVVRENSSLRKDLDAANMKIESLETYNRKSNLIFTGIPIVSYADAASTTTTAQLGEMSTGEHAPETEKTVIELVRNNLHVNLVPQDISIAHRLRQRNPGNIPAPVIVKFTNLKARDTVYRARRSFRDLTEHRIFVNEDLTKGTATLFRRARDLVKAKTLHSAWTTNGILYVKRSNDSNSRPHRINFGDDFEF
jgi:hypothetical protein